MKIINFQASEPSVFWTEFIISLGANLPGDDLFRMPEETGTGTAYYHEVGPDLSHIELRMKVKDDLALELRNCPISDRYEILVFYHGPLAALKANEMHHRSLFQQLGNDTGEGVRVNLTFFTHYKRLPDFVFEAGDTFRLYLVLMKKEWLSAILPKGIYSDAEMTSEVTDPASSLVKEDRIVYFSELFSLLKRFHETKSTERLIILGQLYQLLGDYFSVIKVLRYHIDGKPEEVCQEDLSKLNELAAFLKSIESESLPSLEELSKRVGLSKTKMCLLFRRVYHESISGYHGKLKLQRAKELLADTHENIGQIGSKLAIGNKSYFTRWFKNHLGVSPSAFRASVFRG